MKKPSNKEMVMTIPLVRQKWYYAERLLPFWLRKDSMYEEYDLPWIKVIADAFNGQRGGSDLLLPKLS